jgi:hypothetical protein
MAKVWAVFFKNGLVFDVEVMNVLFSQITSFQKLINSFFLIVFTLIIESLIDNNLFFGAAIAERIYEDS